MIRFNDYGYLDPGTYELTFDQLKKSVLVHGETWIAGWDAEWRLTLVNRLERLVPYLWDYGVEHIYVDGSFCSDKPRPRDIDCFYDFQIPDEIMEIEDEVRRHEVILDYFEIFSEQLNKKFDEPIWSIWKREFVDEKGIRQTLMWERLKVELMPNCWGIYAGDWYPGGKLRKFDEFFRYDRVGTEKGIILLKKG
ncbi:DUF6932 family protein [Laceyella putida]|uniref:DUF6932 family protein n=1 Tax=Laceyella putida TaxID=110101 RepID=A0ABW2RRN8_9BACL